MDEKLRNHNSSIKREQDEIDLLDLAKKLLRHWLLILLVTVVCGAAAGAYSYFQIVPTYQAECMMYVNNGSISIGSAAVSLQDLNASQSLVDTYLVILKSRKVLTQVAREANVPYSYQKMRQMVSASKVDNTEVFKVFVKSSDPAEAEKIANIITEVLPEAIADIVEGSSAKIVDYAVIPTEKIAPSNAKNAVMGAGVGFVLICGLFVLLILFDNTIQSEQDLFYNNPYPLLAAIPEHSASAKRRGYGYYAYGKEGGLHSRKKQNRLHAQKASKNKNYERAYIGDDIPFESKEAYNLLRTNVMYSLAESNEARIIGITSSNASEYKSTTAINLSIALSRANKRVLLMDCDLRLSYMAKQMKLQEKPGLSDYLTGNVELDEIGQNPEEYPNLTVIVSGTASPNPGELLGSERMSACLKAQINKYDYIIVDFSPVNVVSDSLVLGKYLDGVFLVARQNYTEKSAFAESLRKLKFLDINVLGFVLTGADTYGTYGRKYGKKYKKRPYYEA